MRCCIHRGSDQIGGSCVEIKSNDQRLLLDLGLPLEAQVDHPEKYLPDIKGLDGNDPNLLGILISHPHLDHFGLLNYVSPKIPVGMGSAARRILAAARPFVPGNWPDSATGWDYQDGHKFIVGSFKITPYLVDHSAYDSYALWIESEGKSVFYSGDFRRHGRKSILVDRLIQKPPSPVDVLLLEGTSLGRLNGDQNFPTEEEIEKELVQAFSSAKGLALVHASSQNIDRMVSIMRASIRTGRKLVIDLYTAAILEATGNLKIPQSNWENVALLIPQSQRVQIKKNGWFELLNHHSANRIFFEDLSRQKEKSTLIFRPLFCRDLERNDCLEEAVYIYSQWEGYWERDSYEDLKIWLEDNNIPKISIHTSGHASPADLKEMVKAINPQKVVPIHTFFPDRYADLFPGVEIHADSEWWEV
jgi:ribonuclease J